MNEPKGLEHAEERFDKILFALMREYHGKRLECDAARMGETPLPPVRTEPVLRDPRPARVRVHGREYTIHRVVHGQVYGCAEADRSPGTILPPTVLIPSPLPLLTI